MPKDLKNNGSKNDDIEVIPPVTVLPKLKHLAHKGEGPKLNINLGGFLGEDNKLGSNPLLDKLPFLKQKGNSPIGVKMQSFGGFDDHMKIKRKR